VSPPWRLAQHPVYGKVRLVRETSTGPDGNVYEWWSYDPTYEPPLPAAAVRGDVSKQLFCSAHHVPKYFYVDENRQVFNAVERSPSRHASRSTGTKPSSSISVLSRSGALPVGSAAAPSTRFASRSLLRSVRPVSPERIQRPTWRWLGRSWNIMSARTKADLMMLSLQHDEPLRYGRKLPNRLYGRD